MKTCALCQQQFSCDNSSTCWCFSYPPILEVSNAKDCYCNNCLHQIIAEKAAAMAETISVAEANSDNLVKQLGKPKHLIEGIDYYKEGDFFVFTKWYHLRKGYCCKNNCRHCPYGFRVTV